MKKFAITFETNRGRILTHEIEEEIGDMSVEKFINSIHEDILFYVIDENYEFNPEGLSCDDELEFCLKIISFREV